MISAGKVTDVDYYVGSVGAGRESYYLDAVAVGEPPGRWSGRLAEEVGLTGEVDPDAMHTLFDKFQAPDGTQLGARPAQRKSVEDRLEEWKAEHPGALREEVREARDRLEASQRKTVLGWDLTFSVPKSVTVLHTAWRRSQLEADRSGDHETAEAYRELADWIEGAVRSAGAIAITHLESKALAQVAAGGKGRAPKVIRAPELAVASFLQHTSRAIDPQLHQHMVIFNKARCADGTFRALDGDSLLDDRGEYSALADRALAEILGQRGIRMELRPDGVTREVVGVTEAHRDLFSSRRSVITGELAKAVEKAEEAYGRELTGREVWRLAQQVTLNSRDAKTHEGESEDELYERWQREASIEVGEGLGPLAVTFRELAERGQAVEAETFSESDVVSRAVAACAAKRSAWRSSDLVREIEARLPNLGGLDPEDSRRLITRLTERALASDEVVQVSGRVDIPVPVELASDGQVYDRPSARRFAAAGTVMAEEALRRGAVERGFHHLESRAVRAWLAEHGRGLGLDQSEAVHGMATSDAGIVQLVGPAGAGKSTTVGMFADAWEDLSGGGRVHGLAVSTKAKDVLAAECGLKVAANVEQWLTIQARIRGHRPQRGDSRFVLSPRDVVMVDEASMVSTRDLTRIRRVVEASGARLMLTGDPRQLAAVEAGGVMGLLDAHAETYSLSDVRRFKAEWEAKASLALRDRDASALQEYDRHGRIVETETVPEALAAAARAAVADIVDGKESLVVAGSNEDAARVAAMVREQLVDLGLVEPGGAMLEDGGLAGRHDMVMARQNDRRSSLVNRGIYRVETVRGDGGLTVVDKDGQLFEMRADYVAQHLSSAYGCTVHAAQGVTVDRCHLVTDGSIDAAALYVAMTRGRERNTAYVSTGRAPVDDTNPQAVEQLGKAAEDGTAQARVVEASNDGRKASARVVLADALRNDGEQRAALVERERDDARLASMDYLLGRREDAVLRLCRMRLDDQLDRLVEAGTLTETDRGRLGADQGTDHVARLLRGAEQAGHDPVEVLRTAVGTRDFSGTRSAAQALSKRISSRLTETDPTGNAPVPQGLTPGAAAFLQSIDDRMRDRELVLGAETAQSAPEWAVRALGPVPEDEAARAEWEQRAGKVAGCREATGWEDPVRPMGDAPGISRPERRELWWGAWEALGRPEADRAEAAMTDGQLRLRAEAYDRQKAWAPAYAEESMKLAELEAEKARQEALLTDGDEEARQWMETFEDRAAVARAMEAVTEARDAWVEETAAQRATAERAVFELTEVRKLPPQGEEPDRCTAEEWLAADEAQQAAEDPHRVVTEVDVHVPEREVDLATGVEGRSADVAMTELPQPRVAPDADQEEAPTHPDLAAMEALVADAKVVLAHVEDRRSLAAAAPPEDDSHLVEEYDVAGGQYQRVPTTAPRDELVAD